MEANSAKSELYAFIKKAGGWNSFSYAISGQVPGLEPSDDLDSSKLARDKYKAKLASLPHQEKDILLNWCRRRYSSPPEAPSKEEDLPLCKTPQERVHSSLGMDDWAQEGDLTSKESEDDYRMKRMTRALNKVLFNAQEDQGSRPLNPMMVFARKYPLRRPKLDKSYRRAILAGFPEVEGIAPVQEWHPVLLHHATNEAPKLLAREARTAAEL